MSGTLFKSELMTKSRFFIPPEAAYNCIAELGEIGRHSVNTQHQVITWSPLQGVSSSLISILTLPASRDNLSLTSRDVRRSRGN